MPKAIRLLLGIFILGLTASLCWAGNNYIQTNFTAGELSPQLKGRVDITRYANGLETLENMN